MIQHIIVKGKVQGVSFRYYTEKKAGSIGLMGTVKNKLDGSVEIYASGSQSQLDQFEKWCWIGSPYSFVDQVIVQDIPQKENFTDFRITY